MKGLKTGYVMVMAALLSLTVAVGIAAFYPAPKISERPKYPSLSGPNYNSPEYLEEEKKYQQGLESYEESNKKAQIQRKVWGQNTFAATLVFGVAMLVLGLLLAQTSRIVSASMMYAAFIIVVFGAALATYHAEGSVSSIFGIDTTTDLSLHKFTQFGILLAGSVAGLVLGFAGKLEEKTQR